MNPAAKIQSLTDRNHTSAPNLARAFFFDSSPAAFCINHVPHTSDCSHFGSFCKAARRKSLAEMWEIAENLHRLDLTKEQRDDHIRRYAELLEARREVSRQNDAKPCAPTPQGGRPRTSITSQIAATSHIWISRTYTPWHIRVAAANPSWDVLTDQAPGGRSL
jgi:hypothetical protein